MLNIRTFDARQGGNVLYKAFAHPLAAEAIARLAERLQGPLAVYDPDNVADALFALHPEMPAPAEVFVHDSEQIGQMRGGLPGATHHGSGPEPGGHAAGGEFRCGEVARPRGTAGAARDGGHHAG